MSDFDDSFDLEKLALPDNQIPKVKPKQKPPKAKNKELFINRIPWSWALAAMQLSGAATKVAWVLWFYAGLKKSDTIKFSVKGAKEFGIAASTARRGLDELEKSNLVKVTTKQGSSTIVTLLDVVSGGNN